jgi:hypothetical protein
MATSYNVYSNDSAGGPVDYSALVANVSVLTYLGSALAVPSDTTFAVRATDGTSEEKNVDCRVRIVIEPSGVDISARPNAPGLLSAVATSAGGARVDWVHTPLANTPLPTGFKVWLTAGTVVDYTAGPAATVTFTPRLNRYSASISGLSDGVPYVVGVRATDAAGDETNTLNATVTGLSAGPTAVASLTGSATLAP